mgnify:CR=1 FL=1
MGIAALLDTLRVGTVRGPSLAVLLGGRLWWHAALSRATNVEKTTAAG